MPVLLALIVVIWYIITTLGMFLSTAAIISFTSPKGAEPLLNAHIFLVGMNGTGKSSMGQKLAQALGLPFCDTEQTICRLLGQASAESARAALGDAFVATAETGILADLVGRPAHVVATTQTIGDDTLNISIMRNHGVIIYIHRPLNLLLKSLASRGDPSNEEYDQVIQAYHRVHNVFREAADATIENTKDFQTAVRQLTEAAQSLLS